MKRIALMIAFVLGLSLFPGKSIFGGRAARAGKKGELTVHYHRPDGDYAHWTLWTWTDPGAAVKHEAKPVARDDFGLVFRLPLADYPEGSAIGLLPKLGEWHAKDDPDRRAPKRAGACYLVAGDPKVYAERPDITPFIQAAFLDAARTLSVTLSKAVRPETVRPDWFKVTSGGRPMGVVKASGIRDDHGTMRHFVLELAQEVPLSPKALNGVEVAADGVRPALAHARRILDDPRLVWNGPLGVRATSHETSFHLFAPDAERVELLLHDRPDPATARVVPMEYHDRGVHRLIVKERLVGKYYRYRVHRRGASVDILDPYSMCNTAWDGLCLIIDPNDYPPVSRGPSFPAGDAVVYELHVRDFTIDPHAGARAPGKYLGFVETGTRLSGHPEVRTGLDHLKELGVNTIQILPVQNFAQPNDSEGYNWGYMPAHYFAPHGWYASDLSGDARVRELRAMIDALHREGFRVVVDVVYNHTAEGSGHPISFLGAAPWYYYRTDFEGRFENGSGCGNELRTEAPMCRRLILDSLHHFVEFYGADGFRFDLFGLMDYGTILQLSAELSAVRPDILLWGEPWGGGSTSFPVHGKGMQRGRGFSVFNDAFRDALKGSVWNLEMGYVQAGAFKERVMSGIAGSIDDFANDPVESVNYIDCHDNHTFYDRLKASTAAESDTMRRMTRFGAAILLTSQGIPFLHGGQELMRSKGGSHNSYDQPDSVNMVRWENKRKYRDVVEYYRGLLALRAAHPMFRMRSGAAVRKHLRFLDRDLGRPLPGAVVAYHLERGDTADPWAEALVAFNPHTQEVGLDLPGKGWRVALDADAYYPEGKGGAPLAGRVALPPRSALVLFRTDAKPAPPETPPAEKGERKPDGAAPPAAKAPDGPKDARGGKGKPPRK